MLSLDAPFPQAGARALLFDGVTPCPVRIRQIVAGRARGDNRVAIVALLDRDGNLSSATRRVALGDLVDAGALDAAETEELERLEAEVAGKTLSERSRLYKRYLALFHRREHAREAEALERRKGRPAPEPRWSGRARG